MTSKNLLTFLYEEDDNIKLLLKHYITSSPRFLDFAENNKLKIKSKFRNLKSENAKKDVLFELTVAHNILENKSLLLEYEKYGTGKKRAPDFYILDKSKIDFNIEVTRIHETDISVLYNKYINKIASNIKNIPSDLSVSINVSHLDINNEILLILRDSMNKIVNLIKNKIIDENSTIEPGGGIDIPLNISGLEKHFVLSLTKPLAKIDKTKTLFFPGTTPVFYTQNEFKKIGDIISDKVGQMIPNMINIIVIGANNTTFEQEDIDSAIYSINQLLQSNNDEFFIKKGFEGYKEFLKQSKYISAILFKGQFINFNTQKINYLWKNKNCECPLPDNFNKIIESL